MKQKILCPILIPTIISLLAAVVISFIQREQPVRATSQSYSSIIHGWEQVNSDGFGDGNNMEAIRLAVYDNYLFASTENQATGGEVWRSANGTEWDQINVDGFGIVSNTIAFVEGSFNGYLYVGTKNKGTGAELWRCTTCDGSIWTRVVSNGFNDPNNETVQGVVVFSNTLYATVDNLVTGAEVWRSSTGSSGSWTQSNTDGFGNPQNKQAWAAAVFNGYLYVATAKSEDWTPPEVFGVEVWRTDGDDNWAKVTPDGFGGNENVAYDLAPVGGKLYLSTGNFNGAQVWRCVLCNGSDWEHVIDGDFGTNAFSTTLTEYKNHLIAITTNNWSIGDNGIEVWISENGDQWTRLSSQGFGDIHNDKVGTRAIVEYKGILYLGTRNWATGAEVWRWLNQINLPLLIR